MAKRTASLQTKLKALLDAEMKRCGGQKAALLRKKARLERELAKVVSTIEKIESALAKELAAAVAAAGLPVAGVPVKARKAVATASPEKKVVKPKKVAKRRPRGSNVTWILDQLKGGPKSRADLCKAAEKEGMSTAAIAQCLYTMAKTKKVKKTGQRLKARYSLPK